MARIDYRPEIDGLRAVAVVAVVLFHLGVGCPGGFVGVDVFFVISGFLITRIIRRDIDNQTFTLAEFWERRIRRIFPALFVVLVATLAVGYCLLIPSELKELGMSSVAQSLFLANVYFWRDTGYFAGPAESKPLLHTWSLAVEEQFYLLFPLGMYYLRRTSQTRLFGLLAVAALISFIGSIYGVLHHADATFFLLPTRAWELLIGCLLAISPWKLPASVWRDNSIVTLGFAAIILPILLYDSTTPFPGLAAAPPVIGTAAIIFACSSSPQTWLCKILAFRPIVFVGLISYSLYLWHWPVIVYTRIFFGHFHAKQIVFALVASLFLGTVSWRLVETPFRRKTFLTERRKLVTGAIALGFVVFALSVSFVQSNGAEWRYPGLADLVADVTWRGEEFESTYNLDKPIRESELITLGTEQKSQSGLIDFIVWGDSHGRVMCYTIDAIASDLDLHGKSLVKVSFIPIPNVDVISNPNIADHVRRRERVMEFLDRTRPKNLILVARWARAVGFTNLAMGDRPCRLRDSRAKHSQKESASEIVRRNLHELQAFCMDRNITLWIVKQVPETGELSPAKTYLSYELGKTRYLSDKRNSRAAHHEMVAPIEEIFDSLAMSNVRFVDPASLLFDERQMTINYFKQRSVYRDDDHLTRWGSDLVRPALEEIFVEISRQATAHAKP